MNWEFCVVKFLVRNLEVQIGAACPKGRTWGGSVVGLPKVWRASVHAIAGEGRRISIQGEDRSLCRNTWWLFLMGRGEDRYYQLGSSQKWCCCSKRKGNFWFNLWKIDPGERRAWREGSVRCSLGTVAVDVSWANWAGHAGGSGLKAEACGDFTQNMILAVGREAKPRCLLALQTVITGCVEWSLCCKPSSVPWGSAAATAGFFSRDAFYVCSVSIFWTAEHPLGGAG